MVVFIIVEKSLMLDYVAAASPCVKVRRPIYAFLLYNSDHVNAENNYGKFHNFIMVTVILFII